MKKLKVLVYRFYTSLAWKILISSYLIALVGGMAWYMSSQFVVEKSLIAQVASGTAIANQLDETAKKLSDLQSEDQVIKNAALSAEIKSIETTYQEGADLFNARADLIAQGTKTAELDKMLAKFLSLLSDRNWQEAKNENTLIKAKIDALNAANAALSVTKNVASSNNLPGSGYVRQKVSTSRGDFVVAMVVAPGARVIVDTASDSDCGNNCPVLPLADYVARNGGFAGINGSYFCPPDYASCQGKVNSYDTLAVNGRTKAVINRANNVYSVVALVAAYGTNLSFYDKTVEWGIQTSGTGALANHPRLLRDGNIAFDEGSLEPYIRDGRGPKGFIGTKDGTVVIGHVLSATVPEEAEVLKTLGLQQAMNLDGGGSSALWADGGYKVGPGRQLPTAIVLVH